MAISILQELELSGNAPNFSRDVVKTKAEFASPALALKYPKLFEVLCEEDGCRYRLDRVRNDFDPELGQWRKVDSSSSTVEIDSITESDIENLFEPQTEDSETTENT